MFCKNLAHFKDFSFCEQCASNQKDLQKIFFCDRCQRSRRILHSPHKDEVKYLQSKNFMEAWIHTKEIIVQQLASIKIKFQSSKSQIIFSDHLQKLKKKGMPYLKFTEQRIPFNELIMDSEIMSWLIDIKFWQGANKSSIIRFQGRIKQQIENKIFENDKTMENSFKQNVRKRPIEKFKIVWSQGNQNNIYQSINSELSLMKQESEIVEKQLAIFNIVIRLFAATKVTELYAIDDQCDELLQKYPNSKVLYLCKIRANQLIPRGNRQIPKILQQIVKKADGNFDHSDLFYYYTSMAEWQMIDYLTPENKPVFFDLKNKSHYKIRNIQLYLSSLNKAIAIKEKPVYYINLGLGHIYENTIESFHQAKINFERAASLITSKNDALDINWFFTKVKQNGSKVEIDVIIEDLKTRNIQFLISICQHFKNLKFYEQFLECCQTLISRQPQNQSFKINFIKSILSHMSQLTILYGKDNQNMKKAELMIIQLKKFQEIQANRLQKRLARIKANIDYKTKNYESASYRFQQLAKQSQQSCSDYYNLAASYFQLFIKSQCSDYDQIKQCYYNISKALNIEPNNYKYKKLKFFVCCYMNFFKEAYNIYLDSKVKNPKLIDDHSYKRLIQYVRQNVQSSIEQNKQIEAKMQDSPIKRYKF